MRVFLNLSYNGSSFHGWQVQPNAVSVQSVLEDALGKVLRRPTPIVGAGRTDTGVNARMMIAHADIPDEALRGSDGSGVDPEKKTRVIRGVNSIVGRDIAFHDLWEVAPDAHARFDATSRTYHYYVHHRKNPFLKFSLEIAPLDYEAMNIAASKLLEVSDFTSFAKLHSDAKTNICKVTRAEWIQTGDDEHCFVITADRFLRNMVRAVVGTLVEVGRGKLSLEGFEQVVACQDRCAAGTSMPPYPLFLWDITY